MMHNTQTAFTPPHVPYVTLSLLYLSMTPWGCDSPAGRQGCVAADAFLLLLLRTALAVGYGFSALAKLRTTAWREGWAFEVIATEHLRPWVPPVLAALISTLSVPMCAIALLVEAGVPLAELLAWWTCAAPRPSGHIHWAVRVTWALSAQLQLGILTLLPLTDVSVGCLLFHAALWHASIRVAAGAGASASPSDGTVAHSHALTRWPRLGSAAAGLAVATPLAYSSARCHMQASYQRVNLPSKLSDILVKTCLPMSKTSWDVWPCAPRNAFADVDRKPQLPLGLAAAGLIAAAVWLVWPAGISRQSKGVPQLRSRHAGALALVTVAFAVGPLHLLRQGELASDLSFGTSPLWAPPSAPSAKTAAGAQLVGLSLGLSNGTVLAILQGSMAVWGSKGGLAPYLPGGHFWHISVTIALEQARAHPHPRPAAVALLLCGTSRLATHGLARATRAAFGVPPDADVAWFRLIGTRRVDCPWAAVHEAPSKARILSGPDRPLAPIKKRPAALPETTEPASEQVAEEENQRLAREAAANEAVQEATPTLAAPPWTWLEDAHGQGHEVADVIPSADDIQASVDDRACHPWCEHAPCSELTGSPEDECGGCPRHMICSPSAADFPKVAPVPPLPRSLSPASSLLEPRLPDGCKDAAGSERCTRLASQNQCVEQSEEMRRHCARACGACDDGPSDVATAIDWDSGGGGNPVGTAASAREDWCGDAEDEGQLAERGYFVLRQAVPAPELAKMQAAVSGIGEPWRRLCAVPYVPPRACRMGGTDFEAAYPATSARLSALFERWIQSGFHSAARLGWPLEVVTAEFVSVNRWRWAQNASCLLAAVFDAVAPYSRPCVDQCPEGEAEDPSLSPCWLRCTVDAIMYAAPAERLRTCVINAVASNAADCPATTGRYALLRGPMEYAMGETESLYVRGHGLRRFRLLSNLFAWLSELSNTTLYSGYHDWHVDGPAEYGREHKAYFLVSKGLGSAHAEGDAQNADDGHERANLRLLPTVAHRWGLRHAASETKSSLLACKGDGGTEEHRHPFYTLLADTLHGESGARLRAWGVSPEWPLLDALGCDVTLRPGDMLFWREDVWHRTQDVSLDRVALRLDVLRFPMQGDREGYGL